MGTGLFGFGDRDGTGDEAGLRHAQGLAWWPAERSILAANTGNHARRTVYLRTGRADTVHLRE